MTISANMQSKIDKITTLISEGYTLKKNGWVVDFRNSSGRPVNTFGFGSPAGFSWIAFFFPFAVCTQIKEWSYFYVSGVLFTAVSLLTGFLGLSSDSTGTYASIGIGIFYGGIFPYLRLLAKQAGTEENSKAKSIFLGLFLAVVAAIPSIIIDVLFESA